MQIELNGDRVETRAETLAGLLDERGLDGSCVATAVNGGFVPRAMRSDTSLIAGCKVEILSPMQGG